MKWGVLGLVGGRQITGGGETEGAQEEETLADGVDVGQVHELDVALRVILRKLASAATGSVGHGRRITPRIHDQHFLISGQRKTLIHIHRSVNLKS